MDAVISDIGADRFATALDNARRIYAGDKGYNESKFREEVVADVVGEMLYDSGAAKRIAYRLDHPTLAAILDFLREVKRKLFGGEEVDATIKELENVFREKTGKEYEGRTEEEMNATQESRTEAEETMNIVREIVEREGISETEAKTLVDNNLTMEKGLVLSPPIAEAMKKSGYVPPMERPDYSDDLMASRKTIPGTIKYLEFESKGDNKAAIKVLMQIDERLAAHDAVADTINSRISQSDYKAKDKNRSLNNSPIRRQGDIYGFVFDIDTTCERTFAAQTIIREIEKRIGRVLTITEYTQLCEKLSARGIQIPCTYCYVENKRQALKDSYLMFMDAHEGVMKAKTREEAERAMYGHDKSGNLSSAASKVLERWLAEKESGVQSMDMKLLYRYYYEARNSILSHLDELARNGSINANTSATKMAKILQSSYPREINSANISHSKEREAFLRGALEDIAAEWKYDAQEGRKHVDFEETQERPFYFHFNAMALWREMDVYGKSSSGAKNKLNYIPYTDEIKLLTDEEVERLNHIGGLRMHSNNDYRPDYFIDYAQLFATMDGRLMSQCYSKNPEMVRTFGQVGVRINMSLAAFGGKDGSPIMMNEDQGMNWKIAQELREQSPNAGTMLMAVNDAQIQFALDNSWIDMCIPFHRSNLPKEVWYNMRQWQDYTSKQEELLYNGNEMKEQLVADGVELPKNIKADELRKIYDEHFNIPVIEVGEKGKTKRVVPHFLPGDQTIITADGKKVVIPGHHNDGQTYLNLCKEYGIKPRFQGVKVVDRVTGKTIDVTEHPGYIKLIKETARTDSKQEPIKFNLDKQEEYLPIMDEEKARIVYGDNYEQARIGEHMTSAEYGMYKLYDFAERGGYDNVTDYKQLMASTRQGDIAQEFIDDVINSPEKRPLDYLSKDDRMMYRFIHQGMFKDAGLDPETAEIPYHPESRASESEGENVMFSRRSEPLTEKEKDEAIKRIDTRIEELNRLNEGQSLKSENGNSAESLQEGRYLPSDNSDGAQSVTPIDANVNKKFPLKDGYVNNLAKFIESLPSNDNVNADNFIKELYTGLGLTPHQEGVQVSEYVRYTADNGEKITIRLSDHSGNALSIVKKGGRADKGYSIVVKLETSVDAKFKPNKHSDVAEFIYENPTKERLSDIAKGIFGLMDTGKYLDLARANDINYSPKEIVSFSKKDGVQPNASMLEPRRESVFDKAERMAQERTEDPMFSRRTSAPPKKTGVGYKVFVLKDGNLYPPKVANPNGEATPVGEWLDADAAPIAGQSKTGRNKVKAGGKGTDGGSGTLAYRPGWHLGTIPYATQFYRVNRETGQKELFPSNFVWAEVEYANDVNYQNESMASGINDNGKFQHSYAGLQSLPKDGAYMYTTNKINQGTMPWIITGAMRVKRLLLPSEVDAIVRVSGREPQKRQEGAVTDEQVAALNKKLGLTEPLSSPKDVWSDAKTKIDEYNLLEDSLLAKNNADNDIFMEQTNGGEVSFSKKQEDNKIRLGETFSKDKEPFDKVRERAIKENGVVMPNLNKESVDVVDVPKHDFVGYGKEIRKQAIEWAKENLLTKADEEFPTMRDGTPYKISLESIKKFIHPSATGKSDNLGVHLAALKSLKDIIKSSVESEIHPDYNKGADGQRDHTNGYNDNGLIHRLYGAISIDGKLYRVKTTMHEYRESKENNAHSYEVTEIELLDAPSAKTKADNGNLEMTSNNSISLAKLLDGVEKSYDPGKKLLDESKTLSEGEISFSKKYGAESYKQPNASMLEPRRESVFDKAERMSQERREEAMFSRKSTVLDAEDFADTMVAREYDKRMRSAGFIMSEVYQDHMQSLHEFMNLAWRNSLDVTTLPDYKNPYIGEKKELSNCFCGCNPTVLKGF